MMIGRSSLIAVSLIALCASQAKATPVSVERAESPLGSLQATSYRLEVLTDLPIQAGVGALIELPQRMRVQTSLGWMPKPYVRGINQIVTQLISESYSVETAQLVEDTIQDSLVWSIKGGWRPYKSSGFYTHLGYTLVTLGGGSTASELIEGITGETRERRGSNRSEQAERMLPIDAESTLHLASLEVGWEWLLTKPTQSHRLHLRAAFGWSYTFASSAKLQVRSDETGPIVQEWFRRLEDAGEAYLVDTFESYIHPPSFTIAIGYGK